LRERYRLVEQNALVPPDHDEHPAMLLGEMFVPQLVRQDPPPRELLDLPRETLLKLSASGPSGAGPKLPEGADRTRLEQAQKAYQARPAQPVLSAVAAAPGGVVLLGDPGAGKTTLAAYLMLALAAQDLGTDGEVMQLPDDLAQRLPLVVELREFADARWRDAEFLDFLDDRYDKEGLSLPRQMLEEFLDAGGRAGAGGVRRAR
jgi:hypothetical protein